MNSFFNVVRRYLNWQRTITRHARYVVNFVDDKDNPCTINCICDKNRLYNVNFADDKDNTYSITNAGDYNR